MDKFKINPGGMTDQPQERKIFITGSGRGMYLWIGNDGVNNRKCYGTISGTETLRKLAETLLEKLPKKKKSTRRLQNLSK